MAEAMAHYAAQAEHELEAEAMVGAATTVTISRRDRRAVRRSVPHLVRGAAILTRILRLRRRTRPIVRVVSTIIRRTVRSLRRSAAAGQPKKLQGAFFAPQGLYDPAQVVHSLEDSVCDVRLEEAEARLPWKQTKAVCWKILIVGDELVLCPC